MRLRNQNHVAVILVCIETGDVMAVVSHVDILLFTYNNRLYDGEQHKMIVSHSC